MLPGLVAALSLLPCITPSVVNLRHEVFRGLTHSQEIILISDVHIHVLTTQFPFLFKSNVVSVVPRPTTNTEFNVSSIVRRVERQNENVAIVIDIHFQKEIFDELQQIGRAFEQFHTIHRIWVVVIWPLEVKSTKEITSLKEDDDFVSAISHFHLSSLVYFAFSISRIQGKSLGEGVIVYESYITGGHITFNIVQNGSVYFLCDYCEGMSLRRFNFHRRKLKVTAVNDTEVNDDIVIFKDAKGTIHYGKEGLTGSIHEILKELLNFTTEPMLSASFGSYNEATKQWEGSIGDVSRGIADIGLSITIFQPNRAEVVSFLPPADEHLINAFFVPSDDRPIRDIFFQPFEPLLWAAVITTWLMLGSFMFMFTKIRQRYGITDDQDYLNEGDEEEEEHDFSDDSFIWAIGTACQQGWDEHPKASSLRAIFISGSFTGVVAYAGYSAAIVSTLSIQVDQIQNPLQLLKSDLHVGIRKGFISSLLEQKNATDVMSKFYEKVGRSLKSEQYLNVSSGLDRLLTHRYAFITTRDTIYDLMKTTKDDKLICGVKDMPVLKYGFPLGYPVPKFSPFREVLRYAMTMIREPGILYRLRMKHSFQRRCLEATENVGYVLALGDMFTAYVILLAGFTFSVVFLAGELLFSFQNRLISQDLFVRLP